jgi:hypothetical protein
MSSTPFRVSRCVELSILDYLETELNSHWSGVSVVKGFQQATKTALPVVSVRLTNTAANRKELGNYELSKYHTIILDIFATSDGQRLDLADFITDIIAEGIPYYTFSNVSGSKAELEKVADGRLVVNRFIENSRVNFGDDVEVQDKFRHILSFVVRR